MVFNPIICKIYSIKTWFLPSTKETKDLFLRWYNAYFPGIFDKVSEVVSESTEVLDLALEVVTRMLEHKGEFRTIKNIDSYLKKVIESVCDEYVG